MKIFNQTNYKDTIKEREEWHKKLCLRDRCARIICTAWSFGSKYMELVREECEAAGFKEIDEDDFFYLSDFANLHGESLFQKRAQS
jgi:hypothetical protein